MLFKHLRKLRHNMKTLIISAFPGCGKTYLSEHSENIDYYVIDIDSTKFKHSIHWEIKYIDYITKNVGKYDFIFISQHDEVLLELKKRKIPFITVAPNNSELLSQKERQLIKQQWFGRFILRNNSHIINIEAWLKKMIKNYDAWTNEYYFEQCGSVKHFRLKQNEYLQDIINEIYILKESIVK